MGSGQFKLQIKKKEMVPIERSLYIAEIATNEKLVAFFSLLKSDLISLPSLTNLPETDQVYFKLIQFIQTNNKSEFISSYQILSKRSPSKDNPPPFVYNDLLIFTLVCGIIKFEVDKKWLKGILEIRNRNSLTTTFENILNKDWFSNSNLPEVVISVMSVLENSTYTDQYLNEAYKKIVSYEPNYYNSDFLKLSVINSCEVILLLKNVSESGEFSILKKFESKFIKRIKFLAIVLYNSIVIATLIGIMKLISLFPDLKDIFERTGLVLGVLGVGLLGSNLLPFVKTWLTNILMLAFGFPKEKIAK